jgi:heme-degrading monooxygenase HmoA
LDVAARIDEAAHQVNIRDESQGRSPGERRQTMFHAMNRFRIHEAGCAAFETLWRNRRSRLEGTPGFISFELLRGGVDAAAGTRLYISHSRWADRDMFTAWTRSEPFRDAHRQVGLERDIYAAPPQFEGLDVVEGVS